MKILEAIKSSEGPILTFGTRWLEYAETDDEYIIYERKRYKTICIEKTPDEDRAIELLMAS